MNKLNTILLVVAALLVASLHIVSAQTPIDGLADAATGIPKELLTTNIKDWQLNGLTALIVLQLAGRGYHALRNGGGLVGIYKSIVFGTNTPKA